MRSRTAESKADYVRNLEVLHQLWPKAKFVHLIRDGRDVALSAINWKRKAAKLRSLFPMWDEHPLATAAAWWKWHVAPARERGRLLGPSTYYELRYEELVAQPEKECARLCAFLELPFDAAMLRFHEGRMRLEPELDAKNSWRPITQGLRNWRQEMAAEGVQLFEAPFGLPACRQILIPWPPQELLSSRVFISHRPGQRAMSVTAWPGALTQTERAREFCHIFG